MVPLGTASSRSCPQCAQTILPFPTSCGQAIGISTRSAMAQRKLFNVTGGIRPATSRPSTTLPAQNRAANVRRVYGWVITWRTRYKSFITILPSVQTRRALDQPTLRTPMPEPNHDVFRADRREFRQAALQNELQP